jgi:hypothetical protein
MFKHVLGISFIFSVATYCSEYNPTNFGITVKQEKCAGNREINLPISHLRFYGSELDYAIKVDMKYPPLYAMIDGKKKYVKGLRFELYKEKDIDSYYITYSIDFLRDSFFQSTLFMAMSFNAPIAENKVRSVFVKAPRLNERNPVLDGWYLPNLSFIISENLQFLTGVVELLNMVLLEDRTLVLDTNDLVVKEPSLLSLATWRRKLLGL